MPCSVKFGMNRLAKRVLVALLCVCVADFATGSRPTPLAGIAPGWLESALEGDLAEVDADTQPRLVQVSVKPRAYVYHNFLTEAEVAHILEVQNPDLFLVAAPQMRRSTVVGHHGGGVIDQIRTSYGTFIKRMHDPIITRIEQKIAAWTNTTLEQQEDIQVLRYVDGQKYGAHQDGLGRMATVVMMLAETEEGGETIFPNSEWLEPAMADGFQDVSDCARGFVGIKPKRGTALLFYDQHPDGTSDPHATHTACPVIKGVKWSAPVWIHPDAFRPEDLKYLREHPPAPQPDPGMCEDRHVRCAAWKQDGQCESNRPYMIGDDFSLGSCRATCGACENCADSTHDCYMRNRERAGYLDLFQEISDLRAIASASHGTAEL